MIVGMSQTLVDAVNERAERLENWARITADGASPGAPARGAPSDRAEIPASSRPLVTVLRELAAAKKDKRYPTGEGRGRNHRFQYLGVDVGVRLDKVNGKFWPRAYGKDGKDLSTTEMKNKLRGIEDPGSQEEFLAGLGGREQDPVTDAYEQGVTVRWILLMSDINDNAGASALTERILEAATVQNYEALFTGHGNEKTYGALPSQHVATEKDKNTVYNGILAMISGRDAFGRQTQYEGVDPGKTLLTNSKRSRLLARKLSQLNHILPDALEMQGDIEPNVLDGAATLSRGEAKNQERAVSDDEDSDLEENKVRNIGQFAGRLSERETQLDTVGRSALRKRDRIRDREDPRAGRQRAIFRDFTDRAPAPLLADLLRANEILVGRPDLLAKLLEEEPRADRTEEAEEDADEVMAEARPEVGAAGNTDTPDGQDETAP